MGDFRTEPTLGARIQAARRQRGMRTARDLADAISGGNVTEAIIENIEAGRKANLDVSQLLNIAMALEVPPSYLLAAMGRPDEPVDLPNLSDAFATMTALEFDSWIANLPGSGHQPRTVAGRNASDELRALREWASTRQEIARLEVVKELERADTSGPVDRTEIRLRAARTEMTELEAYLRSAGWAFVAESD